MDRQTHTHILYIHSGLYIFRKVKFLVVLETGVAPVSVVMVMTQLSDPLDICRSNSGNST